MAKQRKQPFKMNAGGGFYIDRRFAGVGRIQKSSRTDDRKTFDAMLLMLAQMHRAGDHDILRRIKDGNVSVMEVYTYWKAQNIKEVPRIENIQALEPAVFDWIDRYDAADITKRDYRHNFRQLLKLAPPSPTVKDIPLLLEKYRKKCAASHKHRVFNYTRSTCQAYLRDTLGADNTLWLATRRIKPFSTARRREGNPQSPRQVLALSEVLPHKYSMMMLGMYLTGMNFKEYLGPWKIEKESIRILGTKREGRDRRVPRVYNLVERRTCSYKTFRAQLAKASNGEVLPNDLRRGFAFALEQAGIPRTRRRIYLGHRTRDVTDLYESHDVRPFLMEDAIKIRKYTEAEHRKTAETLSALEKEYQAGFHPEPP